MNGKRNVWLAAVLLIVFAITRWPGLMPPNFSAAYALMFCAGIYFRHRATGWTLLGIMLLTDVVLNLFYYRRRGWDAFQIYQFMNYAAYAAIFLLGRRFKPRANLLSMLGGSVVAAVLFYVITNTAAWFFNPFQNKEYHHDWKSWLLAMTVGTGSWPGTWMFFRNTLFSSALFTALFGAAMKYSEHLESAAEKKAAEATPEKDESEAPEAEPEKSNA